MQTRAAVVREVNHLAVETIELDLPQETEVLVRVRAAGVCHSDLHTLRGELRAVPPLVLGHEGAGIVEQVGARVTRVQPGDHVLVNWLPADNTCPNCQSGHPNLCERFPKTIFQGKLPSGSSRLHMLDGAPLGHYLGSSTMSEYIVIDEAGAIPIPADVPFDVAAITGCAVATGVGAVVNTAQVTAGSCAAVIGCGGVGLSAIIGCRLAGCQPIVAVDVVPSKFTLACKLGATHTIDATGGQMVKALKSATNGGPDYVIDTVGSPVTISQALAAVKPAGTAVIAGLHAAKLDAPISAGALVMQNKRLLGSFAGSMRPQIDLPKLVELYRAGRLPLEDMITRHYTLDMVAEAFTDMQAGTIARGVILFGDN